jgi:tetratricopeptide (TPR) repeat protein
LAASEVHLALGETGATRGLLAEFLEQPRAAMAIIDVVPGVIRTAIAAQGAELAASLARSVDALLPASRLPLQQHVLTTGNALVLELRGDCEAAAGGFAAAATSWREFGMPFEQAHALFGQGRCLMARGRAREAAPILTQACELFRRLGARPALAEVEGLLGDSPPHSV